MPRRLSDTCATKEADLAALGIARLGSLGLAVTLGRCFYRDSSHGMAIVFRNAAADLQKATAMGTPANVSKRAPKPFSWISKVCCSRQSRAWLSKCFPQKILLLSRHVCAKAKDFAIPTHLSIPERLEANDPQLKKGSATHQVPQVRYEQSSTILRSLILYRLA